MLKPTRTGIGAIAAFVGLLTLLLGCGTKTDPELATVTPATDDGPHAEIRAEIRAGFQQWAGTADDFQAAAVLRAYANNGDYMACMQDLGYSDYHWETSIGLEEQIVDDGTWETMFLAPLYLRYDTERAITEAHGAAMDSRRNNIEMDDKENNDGLACIDKSPTPSEASVDAIANPTGLEKLKPAWERALQHVIAPLGTLDDYKACLGDQALPGHPAGAPGDPLAAFRDTLPSLLPDWRVIADPQERAGSAQWEATLEAEHTYLDVDAACREPLIQKHLPEVAPIGTQFAAEHATEIQQLEEHWASIRADATELGWSPSAPLGKMTDLLLNDPLRGVDESN